MRVAAGLLAVALALSACAVGGARERSSRSNPAWVPRSEEWVTVRDFRHVEAVAVTESVVYFGTTAGLERFDPLRDEWLIPLTAADGLPDDRVTALAAEPGGDAWVGTRRGLVRVLGFVDEIVRVVGPPSAPVDALAFDARDGRVWARVAGLWWSGRGDALDRADAPPPGLRAGAVPATRLDPMSVPWTDPARVRSSEVPDRLFRLTMVARDARRDWFAGTWGDNARVWRSGAGDWEALRYGLAGPGGGPVVRGPSGYWFLPVSAERRELAIRAGANRSSTRIEFATGSPAPIGLARADAELQGWSYAFPTLDPGLSDVEAAAAVAVGDTLWLATEAGLVSGDGETWTSWTWSAGLTGPATALAVDGDRLWVGTRDGVVLWSRSHEAIDDRWMRSRHVSAIAVADDAVFVGGDDGLWAGRRDSAAAAPASLERVRTTGGRVRALALSGTSLLVATDAGLEVFDRVAGTWRRIPIEDGRLGSAPLALAADPDQVWIGTARGLVRWRTATGEWRTYGLDDGLAGLPVLDVLAEADHVWASTPVGVSRFAWRAAEP